MNSLSFHLFNLNISVDNYATFWRLIEVQTTYLIITSNVGQLVSLELNKYY